MDIPVVFINAGGTTALIHRLSDEEKKA